MSHVTKEYIEREYQLSYLNFKLAKNENEQWDARKEMSSLAQIAAQEYGFEFADSLKQFHK